VLRQRERGAKIDVDLLLPFSIAHLPEVAADARAGAVDEDVQAGDGAQRRLGKSVSLAYVRKVGRDTPGGDALSAPGGVGLLDRCQLASGDDDIGALTRQPLGVGRPMPRVLPVTRAV
jgi:hypothetical protein